MNKELEYEFNNFANLLNKDCMNLMECLKKQDKDNKPILYLGKHFKKIILPYEEYQKLCNRLEAIDNANPSEALECVDKILGYFGKAQIETMTLSKCNVLTIKQALLKVQENTRSEEILQKYYQEGITLDSVRALREENTELRQKAQFLEEEYNNLMKDKDNLESELFKLATPKQYLKWEDLEFKNYEQEISVLLNDNKYSLKYTLLPDDNYYMVWIYKENKCIFSLDGKYLENKQFFNDLHLERVE